jgi:hypothetical protein
MQRLSADETPHFMTITIILDIAHVPRLQHVRLCGFEAALHPSITPCAASACPTAQ